MKKMEQAKRKKINKAHIREKREQIMAALDDPDTVLASAVEHVFDYDSARLKDELAHHDRIARLADVCDQLAKHPLFTTVVVLAICFVGVLEALITNGHEWAWIFPTNIAILVLFIIEIIIKVLAEGRKPWRFFRANWNVFDFLVVALAIMDLIWSGKLGPVGVIRMLRLLRVVRLMHSSPGLRSVVHALLLACHKVSAALLMTAIANYIFTVIGVLLFARNDPQHFGSLPVAMMTVWRIETLDDWEGILRINMLGCEYGYWQKLPNGEAPDDDLYDEGVTMYPDMTYACVGSRGFGWVAVVYCSVVVTLGGSERGPLARRCAYALAHGSVSRLPPAPRVAVLLPAVLIGIVSIAFDEATSQIKQEKKDDALMEKILLKVGHWSAEFVTEEQIAMLRHVFEEIDRDGEEGLNEEELLPFLEFVCKKYLTTVDLGQLRPSECRGRIVATFIF